MVRRLLIIVGAVIALVASPAAAQYAEFVVTPNEVTPGSTVSATGEGCSPGETVEIHLAMAGPQSIRAMQTADIGPVVGTGPASSTGTFSVSFTVPANAQPGRYTVTAVCGDVSQVESMTVDAQTPPTTNGNGNGNGGNGNGELPTTGSNLNGFGLAGAGLIAVGGFLLLATRRRRTSAA